MSELVFSDPTEGDDVEMLDPEMGAEPFEVPEEVARSIRFKSRDLLDVQDIVSGIDDQNGIFEDGVFVRKIQDLQNVIDCQRIMMGFGLYDNNQRTILVYEAYRTAVKFNEVAVRGDGSNVFIGHLLAASKILVQVFGITGIAPVLATLKHDWVEDFTAKELTGKDRKAREAELYDELVEEALYSGLLENFDQDEATKVTRRVRTMVEGVTKLRRSTKRAEIEHTFKLFLTMILKELRTLCVKGADRIHNLRTIEGFIKTKGMDKAKGKATETLEKYLPLFRIAGFRTAVRETVWHCVNLLNPKLYADYTEKLEERLATRLTPYQEAVFAAVSEIPEVSSVRFVPRSLDYYTEGKEFGLDQMEFEALGIANHDPMFEVYVEMEAVSPDEIELDEGADMGEALMRETNIRLMRLKRLIMKTLLPGDDHNDGRPETTVIAPKSDLERLNGLKMPMFIPSLGGKLDFRINDEVSENLSARGILSLFENTNVYGELKNMIVSALNKTMQRAKGSSFAEALKRELLSPRISVRTPGNEVMEFPSGATVRDFAASVHGDVLIGMQRAYMRDSVLANVRGVPVELNSLLIPGKIYEIETCFSGTKPKNADQVEAWAFEREKEMASVIADPEDFLFCQANARSALHGHFAAMPQDLQVNRAEEYLEKLSVILGVDSEEIIDLLQDKYTKSYEGAILGKVARRGKDSTLVKILCDNGFLTCGPNELAKAEDKDEQVETAFREYIKSGLAFEYEGNEEMVNDYIRICDEDVDKASLERMITKLVAGVLNIVEDNVLNCDREELIERLVKVVLVEEKEVLRIENLLSVMDEACIGGLDALKNGDKKHIKSKFTFHFGKNIEAYYRKEMLSELSKSFEVAIRRRYRDEVLTRVACGNINPVAVVADYYAKHYRVQEKKRMKSKPKRRGRFGLWKVQCEVAEETGGLANFASTFEKEAQLPIHHFEWHKIGRKGEPAVLSLDLDFDKSPLSVYGFFLKLVNLNSKFPIVAVDPLRTGA
jgi:hypothetical protein